MVSIADVAYKDYFADINDFDIQWVPGHHPQAVADKLAAISVPENDYFIWLTGEGEVVKSLMDRFESADIDQQLVRAQAYWHKK